MYLLRITTEANGTPQTRNKSESAYQYECMYQGKRYRDIHVLRVATGTEETAYQREVKLKKRNTNTNTNIRGEKKKTASHPDLNAGTNVPTSTGNIYFRTKHYNPSLLAPFQCANNTNANASPAATGQASLRAATATPAVAPCGPGTRGARRPRQESHRCSCCHGAGLPPPPLRQPPQQPP